MSRQSNLFLYIIFLVLFLGPLFVHAITVEVTATVAGCGDDAIGSGEQCDGANLGGSSCSTQGFSGGSLSCSSACTFNTSACTTGNSNGNSGNSGNAGYSPPAVPATNVVFSGRAYPLSRVSILKDGQLAVTTIAGPDSNFIATISGLSSGDYNFVVYGEDKNDVRSSLFPFSIFITSGVTTKISGIFIAPTISVNKSKVKHGDNITIFGQSIPNSEITISVHSHPEYFSHVGTDASGVYLYNFDNYLLDKGRHTTRSKSSYNTDISSYGQSISFVVGNKNVLIGSKKEKLKGDVNNDGKVNLIDFSITAFWYKRNINADFNSKERDHLNGDGKVDLIDLSIMAYNWTG